MGGLRCKYLRFRVKKKIRKSLGEKVWAGQKKNENEK